MILVVRILPFRPLASRNLDRRLNDLCDVSVVQHHLQCDEYKKSLSHRRRAEIAKVAQG